MKRFIVLFEKSEDGYSAYVPDLPGCVAFGDTIEEVESLIYEGINFHLEGLLRNGEKFNPTVIESETMVFP